MGKQTPVKAVLSVTPEKEVQKCSSVDSFHFRLLADDSVMKEQKSPFCPEEIVEGTFFFNVFEDHLIRRSKCSSSCMIQHFVPTFLTTLRVNNMRKL